MRRRWLLVPVVLGLLALGITAGTLLAQNGGSDLTTKTFAGRVAAILELEESKVQDAFTQASLEVHEERLQNKLDRLVEEGEITQEEADKYLEWFKSRPEGIMQRGHFGGHNRAGSFGGYRFGSRGAHGMGFFSKAQ